MALALADVLKRADARLGVRGMDADVVRIVRDVIKELHPQGIYVGVAQAMRTIAEQNALYAQGRRGIAGEKIVTNARGGQSNHNYGVAVDLFVYPGTFAKAEFLQPSDTRMKKIVAAMKKRGMKWGGDWDFKDYPHFELYAPVYGQKKPSLAEVPAVKPSSSVYIVKDGDSLWKISKDKDISIANLKKFNNLKSDVIHVGQVLKLKASAKAVTKPKPPGDIVPYPGIVYYKGQTGMKKINIERIQRAVKAEVTGKFDAQTEKAVEAYQKRHGLDVDGAVGPATHSKMF